MVILLNISNNIGAMTARCVHGSGAWTGRNLILDEGLLPESLFKPVFLLQKVTKNRQDFRH